MVALSRRRTEIVRPTASCEPSLHDLASQYLENRALTLNIAERAGIEPVQNAMLVNRGFKKLPALMIRYFDPLSGASMTYEANGEQRPFLRVRYLGADAARGFTKTKRPQRFAQPKGSPVFAYFAPNPPFNWRAVLTDTAETLVVVEGEVKGLCACAHGIYTIALGGVDSFRNNGVFLPELEAITWRGRHVIVCYDSDISQKPGVQAAEARLAVELKKRGAIVHLARLPNAKDGSKLGLDDAIKQYGTDEVQAFLLETSEASEFETVIDLAPQRLVENLEQLDEVFAASGLPVFQRSGMIVHVAAAGDTNEGDDVRRATDASVIREVSDVACQQLAMHVAKFTKWNERKKAPVPTECPFDLARHYVRKVGGWKLNKLKGVVEAPTIRPDDTVLQTPGYDTQSGILFLPNGEFPPVPDAPSKSDALAGYQKLRRVVRGFEFASSEAESVWIAATMTALVRRALRTAPLFAVSAPVMGAGKTLAADLVSIIATGHEPAVMSQGRSPEEDRKRLLSVLMRGDGVIQIDNCELPIEGDALCAILTSPEWQDRVLGHSEMVRVPTNATFLATGNNLTFHGDMSTRALMCKILPKRERPEERFYDWDARAEARTMRAELVAAILTIIRAYAAAGYPEVEAKTFGRFEEWQALIQRPLLWLGASDPCKTRELVERNDPDREAFARLVYLWSKVFGENPIRTKDISELGIPRVGAIPETRELYDLACELSGGKGRDVFNAVVFGKYLVAKEERLSGGYRLIQGEDKKRKVATWRLWQA
ncbi:MAG: DUF3854 domain-containing protein [Alphaproteobacteria bacterium]|nr:DUF3854 domain-containing protein [Alphaproteobacteria bacterium]